MVFKVLYIVTYLFGAFYIRNFMTAFLGNATTPKVVYRASYLLYPLIVCTLYFTVNVPIVNLIGNVAALFIISLNFRCGAMKRTAFLLFLYLFMMFTEAGVAIATGYIGISAFEEGTYSQPLGLIVVALILYSVSLLCCRFKKMRGRESVRVAEWIVSVFIPIASVYIIVLLFEKVDIDRFYGVGAIIAILIINIIVFYLYDSLLRSYNDKLSAAMFEQEKEYYYNQCRYMEKTSEDTKRFRHDLRNHLFEIASLIRGGNTQQAQSYISDIIGERLTEEKLFSNTGNIAIDSVINYKLGEASSKNISVEADIDVPDNLVLEPSDITAVVGNLVDNAISAVLKLEEHKRYIHVNVCYDKGCLFIKVKNSFDGEINIKNGRPVSSHPDKKNHGYGLKNVEQTIEKYKGYVEYDDATDSFEVSTMMYIKSRVTQ